MYNNLFGAQCNLIIFTILNLIFLELIFIGCKVFLAYYTQSLSDKRAINYCGLVTFKSLSV